MLHFHKWSLWEDTDKAWIELYSYARGEVVKVGKCVFQTKTCSICGKKKLRIVETRLS